MRSKTGLPVLCSVLLLYISLLPLSAQTVHTWEMQEIVLKAAKPYAHAYKDVDAWVEGMRKKFRRRADLVDKSLKALDGIVSEKSELANEWAQTDEHVAWRGMIEQLRARVSAQEVK